MCSHASLTSDRKEMSHGLKIDLQIAFHGHWLIHGLKNDLPAPETKCCAQGNRTGMRPTQTPCPSATELLQGGEAFGLLGAVDACFCD